MHDEHTDDDAQRVTNDRFRSKRARVVPLALVLIALLVIADRQGWLLAKHVDDMATYHGQVFPVINVISGDVIEIDAPDALHERPTTQVRLWGIAAPQPPRPGREGETGWREAIDHASSIALHREVILQLESHRKRDPLGRVLAHVHLHNDGGTLNEAMLSAGFASRDEQFPHLMLTAYAQAENRARQRGSGTWASAPVQ